MGRRVRSGSSRETRNTTRTRTNNANDRPLKYDREMRRIIKACQRIRRAQEEPKRRFDEEVAHATSDIMVEIRDTILALISIQTSRLEDSTPINLQTVERYLQLSQNHQKICNRALNLQRSKGRIRA